ncbi:MAG: hypothetical protein IJS73_04925 [Paludibacteraceae bacterium]|nr:hypothetical protein [Paludibacteraceae bacterium]
MKKLSVVLLVPLFCLNILAEETVPPQSGDDNNAKKTKFAFFMEAIGTISKPKGAEKIGGSAGADATFGVSTLKRHLYLGPAIGFSQYWHNEKTSYAKTQTEWMYMPIYADFRGFFLGKDNDVYIDLGIGGYVGFNQTVSYTPKSGKSTTYKDKTKGGVYFRVGLGASLSVFQIGVGYEMKKPSGGDAMNSAYFKLGIGIR